MEPSIRSPIQRQGQIVKTGIEALGKPLLFWRSFYTVARRNGNRRPFHRRSPGLSMGGKFLYENEMPGLSKEGITPRIKETASLFWKIYLGLTFLKCFSSNSPAAPSLFSMPLLFLFQRSRPEALPSQMTAFSLIPGIATAIIVAYFYDRRQHQLHLLFSLPQRENSTGFTNLNFSFSS